MTDIRSLFDTFTAAQNEAALMVLDSLSRPLTVREIEAQLRDHGVSKSRAVVIAASIKNLHIIAMIGGEHG